jgi:hypothetical protein
MIEIIRGAYRNILASGKHRESSTSEKSLMRALGRFRGTYLICRRRGHWRWACFCVTLRTAIQARLAKDFRNLIHPGRAQRTNEVCDKAAALPLQF